MVNPRSLLVILPASLFIIASLPGCGDNANNSTIPPIPAVDVLADNTGWPSSLPTDSVQPWERLDAAGNVIPVQRNLFGEKAGSLIDADSLFIPGVERENGSAVGIADNGEATRFVSGAPGASTLTWATYRLTLGGEQPGAISADVNLLPMTNGNLSSYFLGLSNYGTGGWEWYGPFCDHAVRLSLPTGDYLSGLGNLFVCVAAFDGATFDTVGIAANPRDAADSMAPPTPSGLTAIPVAGGLELSWDEVIATDLVGYRIYYCSSSFTSIHESGVQTVPYLEGTTSHILPGTGSTYIRVSAVDISGNESPTSEIADATPLGGDAPVLRLSVAQPSGMVNDEIALTATGADSYDWDLDGDGTFDVTGDASGTQLLNTSQPGLIRPLVRGSADGGSCVACSGVSVCIGSNSRPLANGMATPAFGPAPLSVTFTGTGEDDDGTITGYSWDFDGDGTYDYTHATEPNPPAQLFNTPGTYNAKFRVEDNLGLTDVDTLAVNVSTPLNDPPTADVVIGTGEERGNAPHFVNFDASGSTDSDGTIEEYVWDFDGDGDYDELSTSPSIAYTYTQPGDYTAVVRVQDDAGAQDTASVVVSINYPPVADLTSDVTSGDPPFTVNFNAGASIDLEGPITDFLWDLDGDGIFNEPGDEVAARGNATAAYTYVVMGVFQVKVTVFDDEGAEDTATLDIRARGWVTVTIDTATYAGDDQLCLTVVNGNPAISYDRYEVALQYVRSTTPTGTSPVDWTNLVTIATGDHETSSLEVVEGNPAISYYDYDNGSLNYVRSTTATGASTSDWTGIVVVDDSGRSGEYTSLAIIDGNPAISYAYMDPISYERDLKYARSTTTTGSSASDWSQIVTVDSADGVGYSTSLEVVDGCPAISYFDSTNADLKYARATTSTGASAGDWSQIMTVDSGGMVGWCTSLAIVDGCPAISYLDSTNSDLKFARATTATGGSVSDWTQIVTVESTNEVGWDTSLAIVDGNPAISYYDRTNGTLKYARSDTATGGDSDWTQIVTVDDSSPDVGENTSLAVVNGSPAIAYYDNDNDSLKYAYLVQ